VACVAAITGNGGGNSVSASWHGGAVVGAAPASRRGAWDGVFAFGGVKAWRHGGQPPRLSSFCFFSAFFFRLSGIAGKQTLAGDSVANMVAATAASPAGMNIWRLNNGTGAPDVGRCWCCCRHHEELLKIPLPSNCFPATRCHTPQRTNKAPVPSWINGKR